MAEQIEYELFCGNVAVLAVFLIHLKAPVLPCQTCLCVQPR